MSVYKVFVWISKQISFCISAVVMISEGNARVPYCINTVVLNDSYIHVLSSWYVQTNMVVL